MANSKTREKRRAARMRKSEKARSQKQDPEILEDDEDLDLEGEGEETLEPVAMKGMEQVDKDYAYPDMAPTYLGPTTWDEVDALEAAQEQAQIINDTSWTARDMVRSIITSPLMSPDDKAKAISDVGKGFAQRVKAATGTVTKKQIDDMDLLEVEALIAKDNRHTPVLEKMGDWIKKKKLTASAENKLSDDDFALVKEEDGKKVRKYPIHDKAHVRNALARAAQMIKQGGQAATDAKAALPKIHAAAKKMGIGSIEKSANAVIVQKDASGTWRWLGWPSNNYIDYDHDIISEVAHKEYVDWVNKNMDVAPVFLCHHIPGTNREARADFVAYEDGFLIMSGPLTQKEAAGLLRAQALTNIGMSHGTFVLERDASDPRVITKYRMVEVSDLPLSRAANPFTDFETITKEADMAELDTKAYLVSVLGEAEAEKFLAKTGMKNKALQTAGVEAKEKKDEETPETKEYTTVVNNAPINDALLKQLVEAVGKEFDMEGLSEMISTLQTEAQKVPILEGLVKELKGSQDQALAEKIAPPAAKLFAWQEKRKSQSKETILDESKEEDRVLKAAIPEVPWLNAATNTKPLAQ